MKDMTQLIVTLNENSLAADIKKAIKMLRGVAGVTVYKDKVNRKTQKAIEEMRKGGTIKCADMDDYLKLVENEI